MWEINRIIEQAWRTAPCFVLNANKKGAYKRLGWRQMIPSAAAPHKVGAGLRDLILRLLPELTLYAFHLIFQTELQFL